MMRLWPEPNTWTMRPARMLLVERVRRLLDLRQLGFDDVHQFAGALEIGLAGGGVVHGIV